MGSAVVELTIKSQRYGPVKFRYAPISGHVYLMPGLKPGQHGRWLCKQGRFLGPTLSTTPGNFVNVWKRWHKHHIEYISDYGYGYHEHPASAKPRR